MRTGPRVRRPGTTLLPLALCGALVVSATATAAGESGGERPSATPSSDLSAVSSDRSGAARGDEHPWTKHSSDGRPGRIAPLEPSGRLFAHQKVTGSRSYRVARGVTFRRWRWRDARGRVRAQVLKVDLDSKGVTLDLLSGRLVPRRAKLTALVRRRGAIAGVNGDFFDIDDTGAPLGNARGRRSGLRSAAAESGWTKSFWITPGGRPMIGRPHLEARVPGRPWLRIDQWNSPTVAPGHVGIYRPSWGRTSGRHVVGGQRRHVREVVVRRGRVRANRGRLRSGRPIRSGFVLVGRGAGADRLRGLRRGSRVGIRGGLSSRARVAISGSVILRDRGRDNTIDDREMHPRTAIGIDRDRNRILLLVVDGRYRGSRGLTMRETSELMRRLGAESALNLDGGGSSTMVARRRGSARLGVLNRPSDGAQRRVPNGIGVVRR